MAQQDEALQRWDRSSDELTLRFAELVDRVSLQIVPERLEAWSEIELTMHQFRVLAALRQRPLRISDLATVLGIRLSSATSLIDRLEAKRLLERVHDLSDRRAILCRLTPLGVKEADALWRINKGWLANVAGALTAGELRMIVHAFEVLSSAIDRQGAEEQDQVPHYRAV